MSKYRGLNWTLLFEILSVQSGVSLAGYLFNFINAGKFCIENFISSVLLM